LASTDGPPSMASWRIGDVVPLPFAGAAFSLVFTRYSCHHFQGPKAVLAEMVRGCVPGGRVAQGTRIARLPTIGNLASPPRPNAAGGRRQQQEAVRPICLYCLLPLPTAD